VAAVTAVHFVHCPRCGGPLADHPLEGHVRRRCDACGFIHYRSPTPVVAVLVEHDGAIVLARNHRWPPKMFSLITGFLDPGEDPAQAAARELGEELGLQSDELTILGAFPWAPENQVLIAYHVRASGELRLGEELAEVKRIAPDKLKPWAIGPGPAVAVYLARRAAAG
jgi:NADH pyrophosphatase NudC (nudix superfamily)